MGKSGKSSAPKSTTKSSTSARSSPGVTKSSGSSSSKASRSGSSGYSHASYYGNSKCLETVWNGAPKVRGKDPNLYRRDAYGNEIYKHSHGKTSEMGWHVDHIKPRSAGGSDHPRNLQVLQSNKNMSLGDSTSKRSYK